MSSNIEIEHKFLVDAEYTEALTDGFGIVQGFLPTLDSSTVRVRLVPSKQAYTITCKGPRVVEARREIEEPISQALAEMLLGSCGDRVVEKTRYNPFGDDGKLWVVDVFHQANEGLYMAEIELSSTQEEFMVPAWALQEVTTDERYYNEYLADHPFGSWP